MVFSTMHMITRKTLSSSHMNGQTGLILFILLTDATAFAVVVLYFYFASSIHSICCAIENENKNLMQRTSFAQQLVFARFVFAFASFHS